MRVVAIACGIAVGFVYARAASTDPSILAATVASITGLAFGVASLPATNRLVDWSVSRIQGDVEWALACLYVATFVGTLAGVGVVAASSYQVVALLLTH